MGTTTRIIHTSDKRRLRIYDAGARGTHSPVPVLWHHGTPGSGQPPAPLLPVADELGFQFIGYDRPGYGASERLPGRRVGDASLDAADIADALGIARYAVIGYSGGGPHALACAAADPRVIGVIALSSLAPHHAPGLDWYDGMIDSGVRTLRAAERGEKERLGVENHDYDPEFTDRDLKTLDEEWEWLGRVAAGFTENDVFGAVDDDLAYVHDWNVDLDSVAAPTLLIHGTADRIVPIAHAHWLRARLDAELWERDEDGHVSALTALPDALHWLRQAVDSRDE